MIESLAVLDLEVLVLKLNKGNKKPLNRASSSAEVRYRAASTVRSNAATRISSLSDQPVVHQTASIQASHPVILQPSGSISSVEILSERGILGQTEIRAELDRVLESKAFSKAVQLRRLLEWIVSHWLAGEVDRIDGYNLALAVLEKEESFDSGIDPIVRVYVARLRSQLERYYACEGAGDPIRIDVPKGSYIPVVRNLGRGPQARAAIRGGTEPSVMVLPFLLRDAVCATGDCQLLTLTDHLIRLLTQAPDIRVASRLSAANLQRHLDVRLIRKRRHGSFIIEGTLCHIREGCQLIVHLSETANGYNIWSKYYDAHMSGIVDLANEVSFDVIREIQGAQERRSEFGSNGNVKKPAMSVTVI